MFLFYFFKKCLGSSNTFEAALKTSGPISIKKVNSVKMNSIDYDLDTNNSSKVLLMQKHMHPIHYEQSSLDHPETKVKSISKNWELLASNNSRLNLTSRNELIPVCGAKLKASSSFSYDSNTRSRPKNIVEKIEKFNAANFSASNQTLNQQQQQQQIRIPSSHHQQQQHYSSTSTLTSPSQANNEKVRVNSGGTNSDDYEGSKDDGFETQSNASSSQNGDNNNNNTTTTIHLKSNKAPATNCDLIIPLAGSCDTVPDAECAFNGFLVTITSPKQRSNSFLTKKHESTVKLADEASLCKESGGDKYMDEEASMCLDNISDMVTIRSENSLGVSVCTLFQPCF